MSISQSPRRICIVLDFVIPANHRGYPKDHESGQRYKTWGSSGSPRMSLLQSPRKTHIALDVAF